jgi:tetratricopeptide (TPR) repeat protein
LFRERLRLAPRDAIALYNLAIIIAEIGNRDEAVALMRRAVASRPRDAACRLALGNLLARAGRLDEARTALVQGESLDRADARIPAMRAEVCRKLRRREEVEEAVRAALRIDPHQCLALTIRARERLRDGSLDDAEKDLRGVVDRATTPVDRAAAWHLLGDLLERRAQYNDSFAAHMEGNRARASVPATKAMLENPFPRRLGLYTSHPDAAAFYRRWGARRFDDGIPAPVILCGFPRSGTTMGEQILAAHPDVTSTDEVEHIQPVLGAFVKMLDKPGSKHHLEHMDELTDPQIRELRAIYRESLERAVPEADRGKLIVDKHPFRLNDLGFVNRIFPEARAIVMVRDPRDACLSGLFQNFEVNPGLVRLMRVETAGRWYAAVMGFWLTMREMLTLDWMEMKYEDLARSFEPNARAMMEFIGAGWHEDVARFHEKAGRRVIQSASYNAVTEPLHTRSIGRWKRYEAHLGPVIEATRGIVEAYGY